MECQTKWIGKLGFEARVRHHKFLIDGKPEDGGQDQAATPKEIMLTAICTCSGMDVVSILQKMRLNLQSCDVLAQTATTETHPKIFKEVKLQYQIVGPDIKPEQALKAVRLSMTKYCGVSAMVAKASPIHYEVFVNAVKVGEAFADFTPPPDTK
ncbi:OsmC family protein [Bdellovibrio sp. ArHS]|uniref:OsmC family protein n=1 Tax=Bdellovibrio sp. ArHS TaxID=1569284 RepID=UPI000A9C01EA|nr:OsmC family protein [Bdellovibrio sp. ArHS]